MTMRENSDLNIGARAWRTCEMVISIDLPAHTHTHNFTGAFHPFDVFFFFFSFFFLAFLLPLLQG
ncbi:hypothetical protein GE21DRAFT_1013919 [Neurospora crassa]|nr:hypothetical protein GE21DRAFT_1013919 [Neurospora crassa]